MKLNKKDITTIIVDDEQKAIDTLAHDLAQYPDIKITHTFTSSLKAKNTIIQHQPDLLFLDQEMQKLTGVELLQEIRSFVHSKMYVVFYSAFPQYMIDAIRQSAFDYLLKPYEIKELDLVINRLRDKITNENTNFEQAMRRFMGGGQKFAFQTITGLLLLRCSDILYFQYVEESRCWIMTLSTMVQHKMRLNTTAKNILNISTAFIRVNTNCIINIEYLFSIEHTTLKCVLYPPFNNLELTASRRYYSRIKEALEIL